MKITSSTKLIDFRNNIYPSYLKDMLGQNPNISFPETPTEDMLYRFGFAVVNSTREPAGDVVTEGWPQINSGDNKWYQAWNVRDFNENELNDRFQIEKKDRIKNFQDYISAKMWTGFSVKGSTNVVNPKNAEDVKNVDWDLTINFYGDFNNILMMKAIIENSPHTPYTFDLADGTSEEFDQQVALDIVIATMGRALDLQKFRIDTGRKLDKTTNMAELNAIEVIPAGY